MTHPDPVQPAAPLEDAPRISFEFFPPKSPRMADAMWAAVDMLAPVGPDFMSVTYGAGGSTRDTTLEIAARIAERTGVRTAGHLTCVDASTGTVDAVARAYLAVGIRDIVALRGDSPAGVGRAYRPHAQGYRNAADLVAGLRRIADFRISVAAYPERHPDSGNWAVEIDNLRRKVDAGAAQAITQFFFDNDDFERFMDRVRGAGIDIPVIPGIATIYNFGQTARFAGACGARIPPWVARRFAGLDDDPETSRLVAAAVAAEQVDDLMRRGVRDFHLYTMNRAPLAYAICQLLGLTPAARSAAPASEMVAA